MERQVTPTKTMFLEIGRKRFQVASFEEASRMFCVARDKAGEGASRTPSPMIVDGRVWAGASYVSGTQPLYDTAIQATGCECGLSRWASSG